MGDYISTTDLQERVGPTLLTNLLSLKADPATAKTNIIARAEARCNAAFAVLYTTPVPAGDFVSELALCVAEYEAYKSGAGGNVPEKIRQSFEDAIKDLTAIAKGTLALPGATAPTSIAAAEGIMSVDSTTALLDADSLEDASW
jgi:phage gp36-like protein